MDVNQVKDSTGQHYVLESHCGRERFMDKVAFESADPFVDRIAEMIGQIMDSDQLSAVRHALVQLSEAVGSRYSVSLNVTVEVFDPDRAQALPLLTTGLSTTGGQPPYKTWGDSSPQRYTVSGEIQVVPHDRCPKCHGTWDFKFKHTSCSGCGAALGKEVKVLLDSDVCPHCEEGHISMSAPECDKCGYRVDPAYVVWG
jgi:Zn-finger nucleic acid-binding protein